MPESAIIGTRIRERRLLQRMRQSDLAKAVEISPSYLNLIEHNRRRIGGKLLLRIADVLGVDATLLSEGAEATLIAGLREATGDTDTQPAELERADEFAGRFPGWAALLVEYFRKSERLEQSVKSLSDRLAHDPQLAASIHEVLSTVTAIRSTASILVDTKSLEPEWQKRFHRNINEDSRRLAEGAEELVRYLDAGADADAEIKSPQDELHAFLSEHDYNFPALEGGDSATLDALVSQDAIMTTVAARSLAKAVLRQYLEDASALPIHTVLRAMDRNGLEPEKLAIELDVELPLMFRRLAALPPAEVGPVGLAIADGSGAIVFRKPFEGFPIPHLMSACPLWPLFQVQSVPQLPLRQKLKQAGRGTRRVAAMAVAEPIAAPRFNRAALMRSYMLVVPDRDEEMLDDVEEVGTTCRVCPKADCIARRELSVVV